MLSKFIKSQILRNVYCSFRVKSNSILPKNQPDLRSLINKKVVNVQSCGISTGKWLTNDASEVNKSYEDVYQGNLARLIFSIRTFSLTSSVLCIATQPVVVYKAIQNEAATGLIIFTVVFTSFFTFVTPILLHLLTRRYVTKLKYCNETDTYVAATYSFLLDNQLDKFKAEDVTPPLLPKLLTSFEVKGRPYFIDSTSFADNTHYKRLMGFEKLQIDFNKHKENSKKDSM